ncbi:MAG: hypothetical protein ACKOXB_15455 [Flavobacteriales bacterium]
MRIFLAIVFLFPLGSFAQDSAKTKHFVGAESAHGCLNYSAFYKQEKGRVAWLMKAGFALSNYPYLATTQGKGFSLGAQFDWKFNEKKNYFFYSAALNFRNYFPHSGKNFYEMEYTDSIYLKYNFKEWYDVTKHFNLTLVNGVGYNWNFYRFNFSALTGVELMYRYTYTENVVRIYQIQRDEITPATRESSKFIVLPALNFSLNYQIR